MTSLLKYRGAAQVPAAAGWVRPATALAVVACVAAVVGFAVGEHQQRPMTVLHGLAYVGDHEVSVTVGGWVYGFQGPGNLFWTGSDGSEHSGGWPACLHGPSRMPITFGEVPVTTPDGEMWRQVVWVDCRT